MIVNIVLVMAILAIGAYVAHMRGVVVKAERAAQQAEHEAIGSLGELAIYRRRWAMVECAWRALDLAGRDHGSTWWAWDPTLEQARDAMVRALGLPENAPPPPRVGHVWADPEGDGGTWEVCDSALRSDGTDRWIEWAVREIGGRRVASWTAEDFLRARFVYDAGALAEEATARDVERGVETEDVEPRGWVS